VVERHDDHDETAQDINRRNPRSIVPRHRVGSVAGTFPFRNLRDPASKLRQLRYLACGQAPHPSAMSGEFSWREDDPFRLNPAANAGRDDARATILA
jgi:hypothetical protein